MNPKLLAFLKSRGLKADATDAEAQEFLRTLSHTRACKTRGCAL